MTNVNFKPLKSSAISMLLKDQTVRWQQWHSQCAVIKYKQWKKGPVGQERLLHLPNRLNVLSWVTCRIFEQLIAHGFQAAQCEYVSQLALKHVLLYKEDSVQIKRQVNTFSSASGAFEKNVRLNSGLKKTNNKQTAIEATVVRAVWNRPVPLLSSVLLYGSFFILWLSIFLPPL